MLVHPDHQVSAQHPFWIMHSPGSWCFSQHDLKLGAPAAVQNSPVQLLDGQCSRGSSVISDIGHCDAMRRAALKSAAHNARQSGPTRLQQRASASLLAMPGSQLLAQSWQLRGVLETCKRSCLADEQQPPTSFLLDELHVLHQPVWLKCFLQHLDLRTRARAA